MTAGVGMSDRTRLTPALTPGFGATGRRFKRAAPIGFPGMAIGRSSEQPSAFEH
jgi:hypothetical protein